MLMLISPAKSLELERPLPLPRHNQPQRLEQSQILIDQLRGLSPAELGKLMSISDELATLNYTRNHDWHTPFTPDNARPAVYAFNGDVYDGLDAYTLNSAGADYLDAHLRILSGLYGLLRPFDLIQPYRLEMGTRLANARGKDLYAFWGTQLADEINASGHSEVVNLASEEYFKSVGTRRVAPSLVTPVFEDFKGGRYKIISFYAKRARGLMVRWAADHGIERASDLKGFDSDGYAFSADASDAKRWVFRRMLAD
ncbi:peroxide stress protein YaaA [Chitinibacteraceae bacterium HSL-7]